ncbi:carboxypeptidase-like regulatory domain-containing protein [Hymenobacter coalescens]
MAQGRHCAACQLTVTDFSQRSDAEVLALLRHAAGGRVCGRFRAEQLGRGLVHAPAAAPRWQAWLLAAATLWGAPAAAQQLRGSHSGGPTPAGARAAIQKQPAAATESDRAGTSPDASRVAPGEPAAIKSTEKLMGRVIDQASGEGLPGVTVLIKGTTTGTNTNADGNFVLEAQLPINASLVFSSVGYNTQELPVPGPAATMPAVALALETQLLVEMSTVVLGAIEIQYPWYSPRGLWYNLRSLPRRITGRW